MGERHYKGITLPTAGDDLLKAWRDAADTMGVVVAAESVAAARAMLALVEADGHAPTADQPAYFDVLGNLYKADGSKRGGVWTMHAMGVPDFAEDRFSSTWSGTLAAAQFTGIVFSSLEARPYARRVIAEGQFYGRTLSGNLDAAINVQGRLESLSRLSSPDDLSVQVSAQGVIPAGETPRIQLGLRGGSPSGGRASLSHSEAFNRLMVTAFPITMA